MLLKLRFGSYWSICDLIICFWVGSSYLYVTWSSVLVWFNNCGCFQLDLSNYWVSQLTDIFGRPVYFYCFRTDCGRGEWACPRCIFLVLFLLCMQWIVNLICCVILMLKLFDNCIYYQWIVLFYLRVLMKIKRWKELVFILWHMGARPCQQWLWNLLQI